MINKIDNLNEKYVVCHKYNGKMRFVHKTHVKPTYYSHRAALFSLVEAEKKVIAMNKDRKKCKFKIQSAGKYFLNDFQLAIDRNHWSDSGTNEIMLTSKPVALEYAIEKKMRIEDHEFMRQGIQTMVEKQLVKLVEEIKYEEMQIEQRILHFNKELKIFKETLEKQKLKNEEVSSKLTNSLKTFLECDLEELYKPYQTKCDVTYKVLFNNKK